MVDVIAGMLRVKNEARWIASVIESVLRVCGHVYVFDDHSSDDTAAICRTFGARLTVYKSAFNELDEARDKNWLLDRIREQKQQAEWILAIDGDELLMNHQAVPDAINGVTSECYSLRVLYLWDHKDQVRTDGVYGRFWRPSLFRLRAGSRFRATGNGGNFHCGNVPQELAGSAHCEARLLHFGYLEASDRKRKYDWYNRHDPNNQVEDGYQHMIQGDPGGPAAHLKLRHAGPITFSTI